MSDPFCACSAALSRALVSSARRERLDALGGADERHHHEHAEREQHRLNDVRAGVAEVKQNSERPAAGKGCAEHLGADQDRGRDHGDDASPDDLATGGGGFKAHDVVSWRSVLARCLGAVSWRGVLWRAAMSSKSLALSSAKGLKKPDRT